MFGGNCDDYCLNDIYTLTVSGTVATWLQLSSAGDVPVGRHSHTTTVLQDGSAVMFGGVGKNDSDSDWQWMNDIRTLTVSGTVATWLQLSSAGDVPVERQSHTLTVLQDGSAVMYGGLSCDVVCTRHNDIYTLTVSGTVATWLQ